jgi:uncharacterized protein YbjQ (UPF0145 family)
MGKEPSALSFLITLVAYSVIAAIILYFFYPWGLLIIMVLWIVFFGSVMAYDSRHWGKPEPDTLGVQLSSRTRRLDLGEYQVKGMVIGTCVKARNMFSAARAEGRSLIGGEARQFTELVEECRNIALTRMCAKARALGCNVVVGFRMITAETMWGATEIIAYGTAVKTK